jgi:tRNA uridine 5-carbamoylmethylation protein Kti12
MRKEVYRIGRQCNSTFVIVHVETPLDVAIKRNEQRPETTKIPQEVLALSCFSLTCLFFSGHYQHMAKV